MKATKMTEKKVKEIWCANGLNEKKDLLLAFLNDLPQVQSVLKLINDVEQHTHSSARADEFASNLYLRGLNLYMDAGSDSDTIKKRISFFKNMKASK